MAEQDYRRGKGVTPIGEMTTRQLRMYVRENAEEASARLESISRDKNLDLGNMPRAFLDQLSYVQNFGHRRSGGIMKDTSRMSKEQMVEYAYALRDLNRLDTKSKYAKDADYKENRERYEKFIRNRVREENPNIKDRERWGKYVTEKGNISKRGYQEYKEFVNFLKNIDEVMEAYGYDTIKDKYYEESSAEMKQIVEDLLISVYMENKGKGLTQSELIEKFNAELEAVKKEMARQKARQKSAKGAELAPEESHQNIQAKTKGKMRSGKIREKQGTERA